MVTQEGAQIVQTEDVLGGNPRIKGSRIGVFFIHEQVEGRGLSAQTVADRYDLDVAGVYRALTYYHEHPDEMMAISRRREKLLEDAQADPTVATGPDDAPVEPDGGFSSE